MAALGGERGARCDGREDEFRLGTIAESESLGLFEYLGKSTTADLPPAEIGVAPVIT